MSLSIALSKISRLALLSVLCAGLFITSGELNVSNNGGVQISEGINIVAADATDTTRGVVTATTPSDTKSVTSDTMNVLTDISNLAIKLLSIFLTPLIMLAGWLLSPDWTFGDIIGLRPILHSLWVLISNVVYVIFGFMLVFVAFANIFGGEHAKTYEMKSMLPKLVTGMLIVPFTWFIVSATLSVANVLTASVIQLPISTINSTSDDKTKEYFNKQKIIPKTMTLDLKTNSPTNKTFKASECPKEGEAGCLTISEFLSDANGGAYNLLTVYAYGIFHVEKYMDIEKIQIDKGVVKDVADIVKKLGFGIIFFFVFGILVIAIVYALFSRAIMLWMYAIFSPLFALMYVMGSKHKSLEKFTIKEFVSLAMVPVYVSAALAFGLMFLSLVMNPVNYAKGNGKVSVVPNSEGDQVMTFGQVTLTTKGDPNMTDLLGQGFQTGQGLISSIIMGFLALAILWMAVMAALGASKITEAAVAPIKGFGDEIGKLAMKAPQYIPIPLPGGKSTSMAGVGTIGTSMSQKVNSMAMGDSSEIGASFGKQIGGKLGLKDTDASQAIEKLTKALNNKDPSKASTNADKGNDLRSAFTSMGISKEKAIGDASVRGAMVNAMEKTYNLTKGELNELRNISDPDQFDIKFKELAGKHKGGLDMLADGNVGIGESDKFSAIFTGKVENKYDVGDIKLTSSNPGTPPDKGTTTVTIGSHSIPDIKLEIKDGALTTANKGAIQEKLHEEARRQKITLSDEEMKGIIKGIEEQLPKP